MEEYREEASKLRLDNATIISKVINAELHLFLYSIEYHIRTNTGGSNI